MGLENREFGRGLPGQIEWRGLGRDFGIFRLSWQVYRHDWRGEREEVGITRREELTSL